MAYRAKTMYCDEATAATYDRVRFATMKGRLVDRLEKARVLRALRSVPPGGRVLDVPVGTGRMASLLREQGYEVVGADISPAMLREARARNDDVPLLMADAESLPFAAGAFDAVVAVRFMFHLPPAIRPHVLAEFRRVSRGLVVVSYANALTLGSAVRRVRAGRGPTYIYPARWGEITAEARQAGLRTVGDWPLLRLCASAHFVALSA